MITAAQKWTEVNDVNRKEVCRKYIHWCDDCPKAYDFSCSGADMKKCTADKDKFLNDWQPLPEPMNCGAKMDGGESDEGSQD